MSDNQDPRLIDPELHFREMTAEFITDYKKAKKGNVSAGKRARKVLQEMRGFCVSLRDHIIALRKGLEK